MFSTAERNNAQRAWPFLSVEYMTMTSRWQIAGPSVVSRKARHPQPRCMPRNSLPLASLGFDTFSAERCDGLGNGLIQEVAGSSACCAGCSVMLLIVTVNGMSVVRIRYPWPPQGSHRSLSRESIKREKMKHQCPSLPPQHDSTDPISESLVHELGTPLGPQSMVPSLQQCICSSSQPDTLDREAYASPL